MGDVDPKLTAVKPLGEATTEVVVLAFNLVGSDIANLPALLEKSLKSDDVQKGIQDSLDTFMLKRMTTGSSMKDLTPKDASDLLHDIANSSGGKLGEAALKQIKGSPEYKKLLHAIADFQASAKTTPFGVWLDKEKNVVYVTGLALVFAGAAVLYLTKAKSSVVNLAVGQLKGKPFQIYKVGNLVFKAQVLAFQPDKRQLGAEISATNKWQKLQVTAAFGAIAADKTAQEVHGSVAVKVGDLDWGFKATDNLQKKTFDLGLTLSMENNALKPKIGLGAIESGGRFKSATLDASLSMPNDGGTFGVKVEAGKGYSALATATFHF